MKWYWYLKCPTHHVIKKKTDSWYLYCDKCEKESWIEIIFVLVVWVILYLIFK